MDCILDLDNIKIETRDKQIFFITHEFVIYKEMSNIVMSDCQGKVMCSVPCPKNHRHFECVDLDDAVLLLIGGQFIFVFDKLGHMPISHQIDTRKIGIVITRPHLIDDENCLLFGTQRNEHIQLINYDFLGRKRVAQSTSWKVNAISDLVVHNNKAYALLDSSFMVACNTDSCETAWTRFEAGFVNPHLVPYENGIMFSCQGLIRKMSDKIQTINIPLSQVSSLLTCIGDNIIFASDNNTNIGSYSLRDQQLVWEIIGSDQILESILIGGSSIKTGKETYNILAMRVSDHFGLVNLDLGRSAHYSRNSGIYRIRQTGNHLLLHRKKYETDMVVGQTND